MIWDLGDRLHFLRIFTNMLMLGLVQDLGISETVRYTLKELCLNFSLRPLRIGAGNPFEFLRTRD